jgi:hypothetical protein
LLKKKISLKLAFGSIQVILSFIAILLAILLKFNAFNMQAIFNTVADNINFYVMFLLIFGFVFVVSGLFLFYDWWES